MKKSKMFHARYSLELVELTKSGRMVKSKSLGIKTNCYGFGHGETVEDAIDWRDIRIVPKDPSKRSYRIGDNDKLVARQIEIICWREIGNDDNSKNFKLCRQ